MQNITEDVTSGHTFEWAVQWLYEGEEKPTPNITTFTTKREAFNAVQSSWR